MVKAAKNFYEIFFTPKPNMAQVTRVPFVIDMAICIHQKTVHSPWLWSDKIDQASSCKLSSISFPQNIQNEKKSKESNRLIN